MKRYMSLTEYEKFVSACEDEILCDARYCPYMAGMTPRVGACEGDYCEEAWDEYCDQNER